jgi:hypothetical protein
MSRHSWAWLVLSGVVQLSAGTVRAQEGPPPPADGVRIHGAGPFADRVELMGFEGLHGNKVVKNAPFSATASTETLQTLADGTTIHRTTSSTLYRDSLGRSRSEVTLSGFGPLQASGTTRTMITIADPVAGSRYALDAEHKIAHQMKMHSRGGNGAAASPEAAQGFQQRMEARLQKEEASGLVKKESLGTQTIAGVTAEGTRITRTIPANHMGNSKALQVVFERWYSPDLQIVVKSTRTDPLVGTTTYTLANVQRTEPAASLFTVPSDYAVKQGGGHDFRGAMRTPPPGAPAPQ